MSETSKTDSELLHEIDKKAATLSVEMKHMSENVARLDKTISNMQYVTPSVLTNYIDKHAQDHSKIDMMLENHDRRLDHIEEIHKNTQQSFSTRLKARFSDKAIDIIIIVVLFVAFWALLKIGAAGGVTAPHVL